MRGLIRGTRCESDKKEAEASKYLKDRKNEPPLFEIMGSVSSENKMKSLKIAFI